MEKHKIRLFVDFDGTITDRDVGNGIFDRFLRPELIESNWHEDVLDEWRAGRLSSLECLTQECANSRATEEEFREELENYDLTPGFTETARFCEDNEIPLMILSDGLDYYIEFLLAKFGLDGIPYRANHLLFNGSGTLGVEFPHSQPGCGKCGNCKRYHIDSHRVDGELVVYAGDGYSDRYAVQSADVIFARRDLEEYCVSNDVPHRRFETFFDILDFLNNGDGHV